MPETTGQFSIANGPPTRERLALQMKVGSNTFQASGDPQDVWAAVGLFQQLTKPVTFATQTVPWTNDSGYNGIGAASAQGIF